MPERDSHNIEAVITDYRINLKDGQTIYQYPTPDGPAYFPGRLTLGALETKIQALRSVKKKLTETGNTSPLLSEQKARAELFKKPRPLERSPRQLTQASRR